MGAGWGSRQGRGASGAGAGGRGGARERRAHNKRPGRCRAPGFGGMVTVASFTPSSPRTSWYSSRGMVVPEAMSTTVLHEGEWVRVRVCGRVGLCVCV